MDAEELFKELKTDTSENIIKQLKQLFFSRKIKELVTDKDTAAINLEENRIMLDDFIANIEQELPEAELIYYKKDFQRWIKMENVDFEFDAYGIHFYDRTISLLDFYVTDNIAELLRNFNNAMPEWNAEFRTLCAENQQRIDELEKNQLISNSSRQTVVKDYLELKVADTAIINRQLLPVMYDSVADALKNERETECQRVLDNCKINFNRVFEMRGDTIRLCVRLWFNYGGNCLIGLCSPEVLLEIDRKIPQWIEEGKELYREFDKQEKIEQINDNTVKVLVKNKMRKMDCEYIFHQKEQNDCYQILKKPNEYVLTVKLQKNRKISVTIPSDNLDRVRKILDTLEASINAINSVPGEYQITSRIRTNTTDKTADKVDVKEDNWKTDGIPFELTVLEIIVSLTKNRVLSRLTEGLTMDEVAQLFDEMPTYIDAINSVPYYFRIRPVLPCDKWGKEK